jgi:hypothetical protein
MPATIQHERDNIYRMDISGLLTKSEFDRCQETVIAEIRRTGAVKLLFVLSGFQGWERDPKWSDLSFYIKYGDSIERIAIVGDERWRSEALMFASVDLRKAPVEYFSPESAVADARAWLTS